MGQYDNQLLQPLNTDRGGLSGIEKGINAYFSERDKRLKREQDEKEYKMGLKSKGLIETEDGGFDYDPYTQQMRNAELEQKQYELPRMKQQDQLGLIKANAVNNDGVISEDALALKRRELENQKLQSEIVRNNRGPSAKLPGSKGYISPAQAEYKALPRENQIQIDKLSGDVATKQAISNNIKGALDVLDDPKVKPDIKLAEAKSLVKLLNSAQGSDAVGAEEAKRLSSLLEFHYFNPFNPGPLFGRAPISEFSKQLRSKSDELEGAIGKTRESVNQLYGRQPEQSKGLIQQQPQGLLPKSGMPKVGTIEDGHIYMGGDPADPASWKAAK